jgi:hypothetical protein
MRKSVFIALSWGKSVHNICTSCVHNRALYTRALASVQTRVHNPRQKTLGYAPVVPLLIPGFFKLFLSVRSRLMPIIHTTYKENNKSKILNSYFLYTGVPTL